MTTLFHHIRIFSPWMGVVAAAAIMTTAFLVVHPLVVFLLALGAVGVVIVLRSPFLGVFCIALLLPLERIGAYESAAGTVRASQVIAGVAILVWLWQVVRRQRAVRANPVMPLLVAFVGVSLLGLIAAPNLAYSLTVTVLTAFTIAVGMLVPQIITTQRRLVLLVRVVLVSAVLVSLFGLFQFFGDMVGLPTSLTGLRELYTKEVFGFPRIQSTFLEPLYFANYLLLPLGVLFAFFLEKKNAVLPSGLAFVGFGLLALNLVLTISRGGYLGAATTLIIVGVLGLRKFLSVRVLIPLILGVVLVGGLAFQALQFDDLSRLNIETFQRHIQNVFYGASYTERIETFEQATQAFWQSPFVGIGMGGFGPFVATHPLVEPAGGWRIVNNEPLEILAETGVLGFLALTIFVLFLSLRSIRAFRVSASPTLRAIHVGVFAACVGMFVQYQTFSTLYIMHVWFAVGTLITVQQLLLHRYE